MQNNKTATILLTLGLTLVAGCSSLPAPTPAPTTRTAVDTLTQQEIAPFNFPTAPSKQFPIMNPRDYFPSQMPRIAPAVAVVGITPNNDHLSWQWTSTTQPLISTEIWHCGNLLANNWTLLGTTSNLFFDVPTTNWWTNVSPVFDTNGVQIGFATNGVNSDNFRINCIYQP